MPIEPDRESPADSPQPPATPLRFERRVLMAGFMGTDGRPATRPIEVRTHPLSGRSCRLCFSRALEREAGTEVPPPAPPAHAADTTACPFCRPQVLSRTPRLRPDLFPEGRLALGGSLLFPNLFPYGPWSAVSLIDGPHVSPIGTASATAYAESFRNCARYLTRVRRADPAARYMAITQNHLPSAGGSLLHPHLQVHADSQPGNHQRFLEWRARQYTLATGRGLLADYLASEVASAERSIGVTGPWHWLAAFAPEGFFEIWALLPGARSLLALERSDWEALAAGVINAQRFYRSLNRNGYNLGLLAIEHEESRLELRLVMLARSNYAGWVRSDHTGFELMLGDMATFTAPEEIAAAARSFWQTPDPSGPDASRPGRGLTNSNG
jgi:galactose-1-phosphate uridylyltransferase